MSMKTELPMLYILLLQMFWRHMNLTANRWPSVTMGQVLWLDL
jgi:hypothetical protein